MRDTRSYSWVIPGTIPLFDEDNQEIRDKFKNELKKQRDEDFEIIKSHVEFLFKTYTDIAREGNEDCFIESIADTDADITYPLISEKLREDKTDKGRRKRLFAVKILGRLARLNLEKKEAVSKIIDELSRVSQEDEDPKIKIEAKKQQAKIDERIRSN